MDFVRPRRLVPLQLVAGRGHYESVIGAVIEAQRSVWIATANLKELMVEDARAVPGRRRSAPRGAGGRGRHFRSVLSVFDEMAARGVELRLLHAGVPSRPFRQELRRHPRLGRGGLAMRLCPRVHLKAVIIDGARLYLGSANWTGAGLGARGEGRRNFELGFITDDDGLLDEAQALFDQIWRGAECGDCRLRDACPGPLDACAPAVSPLWHSR